VLGAHVRRCSEHASRASGCDGIRKDRVAIVFDGLERELCESRFRHAEIEHLHGAARRESDIRRLEVAMHDAALAPHRARRQSDARYRVSHRPAAWPINQAIRQRAALDELENERAYPVALFDAVDRGDAGMIERRKDFGFAIEARETLRVARERLRQNLERNVAIQPGVARPINLTHAAGAKGLDDFVHTKTQTGSQGH
jgi:hypothetical protein